MNNACLAFGLPGNIEWIIIVVIALLIFGKRLPDVARSVGRSIVEFKKGIRDVHHDIEEQGSLDDSRSNRIENKGGSAGKSESSQNATSTGSSDDSANRSH